MDTGAPAPPPPPSMPAPPTTPAAVTPSQGATGNITPYCQQVLGHQQYIKTEIGQFTFFLDPDRETTVWAPMR
eukprot:6835222-Ditylum_brightwellii.AAC.1